MTTKPIQYCKAISLQLKQINFISSANLTDKEIMAGYRQTSSKWIQTGISESYTYNHASPPL